MMHGFHLCEDARNALSRARTLASTVRYVSMECPEAIDRNTIFLREMINSIRDQLDAAEAKLSKPKEVRDVQRPAA